MNICVIGTGYVGLVAGACLSDMGNCVICCDNDKEKIRLMTEYLTNSQIEKLEKKYNLRPGMGIWLKQYKIQKYVLLQ